MHLLIGTVLIGIGIAGSLITDGAPLWIVLIGVGLVVVLL